MSNYDLGYASIVTEKTLEAGSFSTVKYVYRAGHPVDDTGYVKIVFRYAGDFGTPQFDDPASENYCSIITDADCRIVPRWDLKGHTRPWGKALILKVTGGYLAKGDTVTVTFGDTTHGSPGWQLQTFCEETFEFKTLVDPIASYQFKELPESPTVKIIPGPVAKAILIAPSLIEINNSFQYFLKLEDRWGNPVQELRPVVHPGFDSPGTHHLEVTDDQTGLSAESNPLQVVESLSRNKFFWADFHGQSEETIGSNSVDRYFHFGRDYSKLDILSHQGNDFQVTDSFWKRINEVCDEFYSPNRLVTFPGYEWSGNTPLGGDRNVYFNTDKGKIARSSCELLPGNKSVYPDAPDVTELFRNLTAQSIECFTFAHVGGRFPDMTMHDENIEVAVEIHSAWGTFEWLLHDALKLGYRIGICANSDGHKGRPGSSYPGASRFGSYGGLTCVLAHELTRDSVYQAMKSRHFYATTGNRCLINLSVNGTDTSVMMGDVVENCEDSYELNINVAGTAPIEAIDVFNAMDLLHTVRPYGEDHPGKRVKILWSGAEVRGRARMVTWDGNLEVTGNSITQFRPINFWNPNKTMKQVNDNQLAWNSITTGGIAGCIVALDNPNTGKLSIQTPQGNVQCDLSETPCAPREFHFGGLEKKITIQQLPDVNDHLELSAALPINGLRSGDNPIYVRVTQEDSHMAWTSPVYLVKT